MLIFEEEKELTANEIAYELGISYKSFFNNRKHRLIIL